ncbi:hypothetical protein ACRALDRAFT_1092971 [Sodiomyces alcalophilus JCM 7366]|uniref:uncharacterized protein n=1 Tax=Sodiomyces alcalophilus JCM 7366 TaxID=591952 RepID=UPI0039B5081B
MEEKKAIVMTTANNIPRLRPDILFVLEPFESAPMSLILESFLSDPSDVRRGRNGVEKRWKDTLKNGKGSPLIASIGGMDEIPIDVARPKREEYLAGKVLARMNDSAISPPVHIRITQMPNGQLASLVVYSPSGILGQHHLFVNHTVATRMPPKMTTEAIILRTCRPDLLPIDAENGTGVSYKLYVPFTPKFHLLFFFVTLRIGQEEVDPVDQARSSGLAPFPCDGPPFAPGKRRKRRKSKYVVADMYITESILAWSNILLLFLLSVFLARTYNVYCWDAATCTKTLCATAMPLPDDRPIEGPSNTTQSGKTRRECTLRKPPATYNLHDYEVHFAGPDHGIPPEKNKARGVLPHIKSVRSTYGIPIRSVHGSGPTNWRQFCDKRLARGVRVGIRDDLLGREGAIVAKYKLGHGNGLSSARFLLVSSVSPLGKCSTTSPSPFAFLELWGRRGDAGGLVRGSKRIRSSARCLHGFFTLQQVIAEYTAQKLLICYIRPGKGEQMGQPDSNNTTYINISTANLAKLHTLIDLSECISSHNFLGLVVLLAFDVTYTNMSQPLICTLWRSLRRHRQKERKNIGKDAWSIHGPITQYMTTAPKKEGGSDKHMTIKTGAQGFDLGQRNDVAR